MRRPLREAWHWRAARASTNTWRSRPRPAVVVPRSGGSPASAVASRSSPSVP